MNKCVAYHASCDVSLRDDVLRLELAVLGPHFDVLTNKLGLTNDIRSSAYCSAGSIPIQVNSITFNLANSPSASQTGITLWCAVSPSSGATQCAWHLAPEHPLNPSPSRPVAQGSPDLHERQLLPAEPHVRELLAAVRVPVHAAPGEHEAALSAAGAGMAGRATN